MPVQGGDLTGDERLEIARSMVHEWVETTLTENFLEDLYSSDRKNRWVGDGIAELVAFLMAREMAPAESTREHYADLDASLRKLYVDGLRESVLHNWMVGEGLQELSATRLSPHVVKYAHAFAIWWEAWERAGDRLLGDFLDRVAAIPSAQRTSERCAAILSDLSQMDVQSRLKRMDMRAVRAAFQRAVKTLGDK